MAARPKDAEARRKALRERVEDATPGYAPAWDKDANPLLAGSLSRYNNFKGNGQAGPCRVAVVDDEDLGQTSVFIRNDMLVDLFNEKRPRPGEWVCLRFLGKPEGSRMNHYTLEVDRDTTDDQPVIPESFDVPDAGDDDETETVAGDGESVPY